MPANWTGLQKKNKHEEVNIFYKLGWLLSVAFVNLTEKE